MSDRGSTSSTTDLVPNPKYIDLKDFVGLRNTVGVRAPSPEIRPPEGRRAYRSLDELTGTDEFRAMMNREFPQAAAEWDDGVSRRKFMKLMGASLALAGLTSAGCTKQNEAIVPYVQQPENLTPGKPLFYASAMPWMGYGKGVLVEQHEGRPTKIEGNRDHPSSLGAADVWVQASILTQYDPDRSQVLTRFGNVSSWSSFQLALADALTFQDWNGPKRVRRTAPARVRILTETITSPTVKAQAEALKQAFPEFVWHKYDAVGRDNVRAAAKQAFGDDVEPVYDFSKAEVVVALDSNFFVDDPGSLRYANDYLKLRRVRATLPADPDQKDAKTGQTTVPGTANEPRLAPGNRLFAIESTPTLVGAMADHKLRVRPDQVHQFAVELYNAVSAGGAATGPSTTSPPVTANSVTAKAPWFAKLVEELLAHKGKSLVVTSEYAQPEIHLLAHAINNALGNVSAAAGDGKPVALIPVVEASPADSVKSLTELRDAMVGGQVDVLFILGANVAYNAPADLNFAAALDAVYPIDPVTKQKVYKGKFFVAHLGLYEDETARMAEWHIPEAFYLEAWGDVRGHDGTASVIQPLIAPIYPACKSQIEVLASLVERASLLAGPIPGPTPGVPTTNPTTTAPVGNAAGGTAPASQPAVLTAGPGAGYDIVRNTWRQAFGDKPEFDKFWTMSLHNGVVENSAYAPKAVTFKADAVANATKVQPPANGLTLILRPDPNIWDGAWSNNAWLQELPKPLTKLTWDNALLISPRAAKDLGLTDVETGNVFKQQLTTAQEKTVNITVPGRPPLNDVPVWVLPGHPDGCGTLYLGYGRKWAGRVGSPVDGHVGFDAYPLRTGAARWTVPGVDVKSAGGTYKLAVTQNHQVINNELNHKRELVIAGHDVGEVAHHFEDELHKREGKPRDEGHSHDFKYDAAKNLETGRSIGLPILPDDPSNSRQSLFPDQPDQPDGGHDGRYAAWGMVIDQTACIGCNACVIACQAENNIPVVGKDQVMNEREMHWLRIDTYYIGGNLDPANDPHGHADVVNIAEPEATYFQPLPCMHCEKAPCELVCPVAATVHDKEGLNVMVYNRCVGTRYCSNNCPYKVRRFNFLKYQDETTPVLKLMRNPEVTVRARGVMEKCTYCVQRIARGRIEAKKAEVKILADGGSAGEAGAKWNEILDSVTTACQQSCPTQAIIFGNMANPESRIAKLKREPVGFHYGLLAELNTRPRTSYFARIDNPFPEFVKKHGENKGQAGENKNAPHGSPGHKH